MNNQVLKHRFLLLFVLLGLTISIQSCNDDDEDGMESINQTFLEKYYKTQWLQEIDGNFTQYIRFESKSEFFIKSWIRDDESFEECFDVELTDFDNSEIIENSSDKLVIESTWNDGENTYIDKFTLTVNGDVLRVVVFDGESNESASVFFEKSDVNVDDLTLCD